MKVFVTGGAGYIGSHTCKALKSRGYEVLVYDNLSTGHRDFIQWGKLIHGDIKDTQKLRTSLKEHKPNIIIHFAAHAYVGESVLDPGKYFLNNVQGTLSILQAMRDENIKNIVVSGTCAVYGEPDKMPIEETTPCAPINPYGASKLFMERMLSDFQKAHGINWMSLRYFNAAGSSPEGEIGELHDPETHLIPRVILAALGIIPPLQVFGSDYPTPDGTCVRDYIHVDDLAEAHILGAQYLLEKETSGPINLGTGCGFSVSEIIKTSEKVSGKPTPYVLSPRRGGDPAILVANAHKANEILGWEPKYNLEDILGHAWKFIANNQKFFNKKYILNF